MIKTKQGAIFVGVSLDIDAMKKIAKTKENILTGPEAIQYFQSILTKQPFTGLELFQHFGAFYSGRQYVDKNEYDVDKIELNKITDAFWKHFDISSPFTMWTLPILQNFNYLTRESCKKSDSDESKEYDEDNFITQDIISFLQDKKIPTLFDPSTDVLCISTPSCGCLVEKFSKWESGKMYLWVEEEEINIGSTPSNIKVMMKYSQLQSHLLFAILSLIQ